MRTRPTSWYRFGCVLEAIEPRLLLTASPPPIPPNDLAIVVGVLDTHSVLPGDKVAIPITLTNNGYETATGKVRGEMWASDDLLVGDEHEVGDVEGDISLAPGESVDYVFHTVLPPQSQPGNFHWLARIIVLSGITDPNAANDVDFSETVTEYWRFGAFDTPDGPRTNFKLTVEDQNDSLVTFSLSGGGYGEVNNGDFDQIAVKGTNSNSSMQIAAKGKAITSVGSIQVAGPLKSLSAKSVDLRGNFQADGIVSSLTLRDVDKGHSIDINTSGPAPTDPKAQCTITLGEVSFTALDTHGVPIKALTAINWSVGSLKAPWAGAITTKGDSKGGIAGDLLLDVTLDPSTTGIAPPSLTLGSVKVAGDLQSGTWNIYGDANKVEVKGNVENLTFGLHSSLKSFKAGQVSDTDLTADDVIGSVQAISWSGGGIQGGSIGSIKITGNKPLLDRGDFAHANLVVTGKNVLPWKPALGTLSIAGVADGLTANVYGNVGNVTMLAMDDGAHLFLGCTGLTESTEDFSNGSGGYYEFQLKSLTLKGWQENPGQPLVYMRDAQVGVWLLSALKFGQKPLQMSASIEVHDKNLTKVVNPPELGAPGIDLHFYNAV
jgi:hypothetical protein